MQAVVFLHILSAVIWVGGMIAIRFAVHPSLQKIEDKTLRVERTTELLGNFFRIIKVFIWVLLITGTWMAYAKYGFTVPLLHAKESIWLVMAIVFFVIVHKHKKGDLAPIAKWLIPTNIVLGLIAILLGVFLRGF
jgi:uncharacterized membrane protein